MSHDERALLSNGIFHAPSSNGRFIYHRSVPLTLKSPSDSSTDMPLATIGKDAVQFLYDDSGPPIGVTTYPTLILFHGAAFHSPIFLRMSQLSANHGMRIVAVNLRDYPGSTPFTTDELDALRHGDRDTQASMISDRGHELALFLVWFIQSSEIPPLAIAESSMEGDGSFTSGGLSILGWSWGNSAILSFLSHADSLPMKMQVLLEKYLRTYVIYDPPYFALGADDPTLEEMYSPLRDPTIPPETLGGIFALWVSGYYTHSSSMLSSISTITRAEALGGMVRASIVDPPLHQQPSIQRMTSAELTEVADSGVVERSHMLMQNADRSVYDENMRRALFDATIWPRLRPVLVWCDMSPCDCVFASWYLQNLIAESWPSGGRNVDVQRMEGANHFPHWDEPEVTLRFLAGVI